MTHYSPGIIAKARPAGLVPIEQGFYYVKLCAYNHDLLFGAVVDGQVVLNSIGMIAADEWVRVAMAYPDLQMDYWRVLPNRIEAIVGIESLEAAGRYGCRTTKPWLLSAFVASYKAAAAKRINLYRNSPGHIVWERSYQERFIPDQAGVNRVRLRLQNTAE